MACLSTSCLKVSPYFTLKGAQVPGLRATPMCPPSCVCRRQGRRSPLGEDTSPPGGPGQLEFWATAHYGSEPGCHRLEPNTEVEPATLMLICLHPLVLS